MKQKIKNTIYIILGLTGLVIAYNFLNQLEVHDRLILGLFFFIASLAYWANERFGKLEKKYYECFFNKHIVSADSEEVLAGLQLHHLLPMQPFTGLCIVGQKLDLPPEAKNYNSGNIRNFRTGNILNVEWSELHDSYSCRTEPYKMKLGEKLGEVLARYYDNAWNLSILEEDAEKALEQYLEEKKNELTKKDQTLSSTLESQDRLERIRKKLKASQAVYE